MNGPSGDRVHLLSYDWESALLSFSLSRPSHVEAVRLPAGDSLVRTSEENRAGRMRLEGLAPDTCYEIEARWDGGARRVSFRTLPVPSGRLLSSFAVIADPHLSGKGENRKGRLFIESASILRDIVDEINALNPDGVFIAGDVTNHATAGEFALARDILGGLRCPIFAAPGDHDLPRGECAPWREVLGETARVGEMVGMIAVTLNTASGRLGEEGRRVIEEVLAREGRGIVLASHLQLFEDDFIRHGKRKCIMDADAHRDVLEALAQRGALVYVGHQNVPSRIEKCGLMQLNVPQTSQFPCAWVLVREYENGFYHTLRPIRSALLDDASRQAGNAAAARCAEPQWAESYRLGRDPGQANFLFSTAMRRGIAP